MTPDEIKTAITGWCNQETGLQLVEDRSESGADFLLGLRAGTSGSGTVPVDVLLEQGAGRLTARSTSTSTAPADQVDSLVGTRPATVRAETPLGSGEPAVVGHVYLDGLNQHSFVTTVNEVAKTRALLDGLPAEAAAAEAAAEEPAAASTMEMAATTAAVSAAADPWATPAQPDPWAPVAQPAAQPDPWTPVAQPAAQPEPWTPVTLPSPQPVQPTPATLPSPSFATPTPAATYSAPTGQPAPQAQPAAAAFAPTHTVPPQGMQAWAAPDPAGAIVATLGGGLPIQITEVRGAWARVLCSNGWTGWVDGRIIGVAR